MSLVLSLVKGYDLLSDVSSLSLVSGTNGIRLVKWEQGIYNTGDTRVLESLELIFEGSTYDDLASKLQAFDDYVKWASQFHTATVEPYCIYLRAQGYSETSARQAIIYSIKRDPIKLFHPPAMPGNIVESYRITIERGVYWEAITASLLATTTYMSSIGGQGEYTNVSALPSSVIGDVEARIAALQITADTGDGPMTRAWVGFRSNRYGDRTKFQSVWDLNLGTMGTDATANVVDATTTSGKRVKVTFGTPTMASRVTIKTVQATATNYAEQRGIFLVLLRAKLSGAGEVRVRLADGLGDASGARKTQARQVITSTSYRLYEMGVVQIPSPGRWNNTTVAYSAMKNYALELQAERISGSIDLHLDCFVLVPYNEGFIYAEGTLENNSPTVNFILVQERPDGRREAVNLTLVAGPAYEINGIGTPQMIGGLPPGAGRVIVAAERASSSVLGDSLLATGSISYYPRWTTLRGSEVDVMNP